MSHDPPLIFNVEADPGEAFSLLVGDYSHVIERVNAAVIEHKSTIVPVDSQLGRNNVNLQPCCNPHNCTCNYNLDDKITSLHVEL